MENSKPNAFAVLPACVRYDKKLMPNAKLLYAEITALTHKEGYCWASNAYFANLYEVSTRAVRNWLKSLRDGGYITYELVYGAETEDTVRKIYLNLLQPTSPQEENFLPLGRNLPTPQEENFLHNNTVNNTNNNTYITADKKKTTYSTRTKRPTLAEVEAYVKEKGYNIDASLFFEYYEAADWHDKNGNEVKNWKLKLVTWGKHNNNSVSQPKPEQPNKTWCNPKPTDEAELEQLRQEADTFFDKELEKDDGKQVHGFERYLRRGKPSVSDIRKE